MKTLMVLMSLVLLTAGVGVIAGGRDDLPVPIRDEVVTDLAQIEMLESDQGMLEQMRISSSSNMTTMIAQDPMWLDPEMIRLQEQNQAQLDRMIGRRPGQP